MENRDSHNSNIFVVVGILLLSLKTYSSELPELAQKQLKKIGGTLTVDIVLAQAMKASDSFQSVSADAYSIKEQEYKSRASLDTFVTASGGQTIDETDNASSINGSSVEKAEATTYSLGLSKRFITGTSLSLALSQDYTKSETDPSLFAGTGFSFDSEGYESELGLSISQSLLKDAFGYATRKRAQAGELISKSRMEGLTDSIEDWAIDLVDLYYNAWKLQNRVRTYKDNLKRKQRLVKTTKIKIRRGTAEKPDLLQAETAALDVQVSLDKAEQELAAFWRQLVTLLRLPNSWLSVDPTVIPLSLDSPHTKGLSLCGTEGSLNKAPKSSAKSRMWQHQKEASALSEGAAKNAFLPDLKLEGKYFFNGLDEDEGSSAFNEMSKFQNSGYYVGLSFSYPLARFSEKSELSVAMAQKMRSEATASYMRSSLETDWINDCHDLHRLGRALDARKVAFAKQGQRVSLEERRYSLGRSTLLQIIQAGDEASVADFNVTDSRIQFRKKAWKVMKLGGEIKPYLERIERQFGGLKF